MRVERLVAVSGTAALVLATPIIANFIVWRGLVAPQQARTQAWRDALAVAEFKPKLQSALTESELALADWQRDGFTVGDPTRVVQTLQQLAGKHRVTLDGVQSDAVSAGPAPSLSSLPVSLKVVGSFSKLARWLFDVEAHPGLQIDSIVVAPDATGQSTATVKLSAVLRES
jgi:type II secretory pathway component PulM